MPNNSDSTTAANIDHPEFAASFDKTNATLRPEVALTMINLDPSSARSGQTNSTETQDDAPGGYTVKKLSDGRELAYLNYTTREYINQPLASGDVRINPFGHWKYIGVLNIDPPILTWRADRELTPIQLLIDENGDLREDVSRSEFESGTDLGAVELNGRPVQITRRFNTWEERWAGERVQTISTGGNSFATQRITSFNNVEIDRTVGQEISTKIEDKIN